MTALELVVRAAKRSPTAFDFLEPGEIVFLHARPRCVKWIRAGVGRCACTPVIVHAPARA